MKVYELMNILADMPSGADVLCGGSFTVNELKNCENNGSDDNGKVMRCENPKLPASAKVLWAMCELSNNIYGIDVIETKTVMRCTGLTKYMVIKQLHFWRDKGMIERASMGCPAQVSHGEIEELISEAAPPVNGWRLSERGYKSNVFKIAKDDYLKSLAELANGDAE